MKLQQLRYAVETFRRNLNVSEAAEALFTSQPGVSKQIKLLEEEIGVQIFIRNGKRMVAVTPAGRAVLETAERILRDVQRIKTIGSEFAGGGTFTVAASYSHARYVLPAAAAAFAVDYPDVRLNILTGTPDEVSAMVLRGEADLAVCSELPQTLPAPLRQLMCGVWAYALLLPKTHSLAQKERISLSDLADCPLLTYNYAVLPHAAFARAFARSRLPWRATLLSGDNDLLKAYARAGLGVALLDAAACADEAESPQWTVRDVSHCFEPAYTRILLRADVPLSRYAYDWLARVSPDLSPARADALLYDAPVDDFSI